MGRTAIGHGLVAPDGRLVRADAPLAAMQAEAGGTIGGLFVVSALAQLVRLAARLNMVIARPVTVAAGDRDLSLWVRLRPGPEGVDIALVEQAKEAPSILRAAEPATLRSFAELALGGWTWQTDARLQFTLVDVEDSPPDHPLPRAGEPLPAYFRLLEADSDDGLADPLPLLAALPDRRPFAGQRAVVRSDADHLYSLAGLPLFDSLGQLIGYRGKARRLDREVPGDAVAEQAIPTVNAAPPLADALGSPLLTRRIGNALRLPLDRIVANAHTISSQLDGPLRAEYVAYAGEIAAAARHLLELVDDITDLQAIERPDFVTAREAVDLADLARRASGLLKVRAGERGVTIEGPTNDERVMATAEYRRVLQILVNLIGNAVRYSPDGSPIWVRVDEDHVRGLACAVVADQGRGIAPADQERIFERFERVAPQDSAGSGLGLYISRRLAEAMGGSISVESALGQGARFTLCLPLRRDGPGIA